MYILGQLQNSFFFFSISEGFLQVALFTTPTLKVTELKLTGQ